jgi:hypothetical protein
MNGEGNADPNVRVAAIGWIALLAALKTSIALALPIMVLMRPGLVRESWGSSSNEGAAMGAEPIVARMELRVYLYCVFGVIATAVSVVCAAKLARAGKLPALVHALLMSLVILATVGYGIGKIVGK